MRILSQKQLGEIDLPYELVGISIRDDTRIIAYQIDSYNDESYWELAIYSDESQAKAAMRMLHQDYILYSQGIFRFPSEKEINKYLKKGKSKWTVES